MRKLASITLIVIFSSIYYYSTVKNENSLAFQLKKEVQEVVVAVSSENKKETLTIDLPKKESAPESQGQFGSDLGALDEEQLAAWLKQEAGAMDMTNNDTAEVEIKLRASANTLKPEQVRGFAGRVLDANLPANQRILAAYILTLNSTEAAGAALFEVAKEPLPDVGLPLPHSEAELRRTQELALRYMEVDRLAEQAKADAKARNQLKLLANEAGSEDVKNYVLRKLKDLSL